MMDLSKFPLDNQICTMEVASCKYKCRRVMLMETMTEVITYLSIFCNLVSKTIEELRLEWKRQNPVIMGKGLRMPQFEIVKIAASDCQESFQIGRKIKRRFI